MRALKNGQITENFRQFHHDNPRVYQRLVELSFELLNRGHEKYSINGLFEVMRWEEAIRTRGSMFKLNNNYRSIYARMIMENEIRLSDFFNIRSSPNPQVIE